MYAGFIIHKNKYIRLYSIIHILTVVYTSRKRRKRQKTKQHETIRKKEKKGKDYQLRKREK